MSEVSYRYRAFISYGHENRRAAGRLHRNLERYTIPARLRTPDAPSNLRPIFLDRDFLGPSPDLSVSIREALEHSQTLIVICSPAAATSHWVAREVEYFVARHGPAAVLCFIVDGEPNATDPDREALPLPLQRGQCGRDVLAADARPSADGWRNAVLKIIAGLSGLTFADLANREQRRVRRLGLTWAAAGVVLAAVFGALALNSNHQARQARAAAHRAELIADYLSDVLSQFRPRSDENTARSALLPLIDASARPDRLLRLQDEPTALLRVRRILANAYLELNAADRALPMLEENTALATRVLGPNHPLTLHNMRNLGNARNAVGDHEGGARIHRQLLDIALETEGEQSEYALAAMTNLAVAMDAAGREDEARALRVRVYEVGIRFLAPNHVDFQGARRNYAKILMNEGQIEEAVAVTNTLYKDQLQNPGPDHLDTVETKALRGNLYEKLGRMAEAASAYDQAAAGFAHIFGPDDNNTLLCAQRAIEILRYLDRQQEADELEERYYGHLPDKARPTNLE